MDRRDFTRNLLGTVTSFALIDLLFAANAFSKHIHPITSHWAKNLHDYCADLKKGTLTPVEWQGKIEELYRVINLEEILKFIDFENLSKGMQFPDLGVTTKRVTFPKLEGRPEQTVFVKKIFGMKKDRAILPHGHSNMASAHIILKGEMHLRHYDKIRQEKNNLIIRPTIDKVVGPGESSSMSDEKENVHWFIANTESAFTFDVIMLDLLGKHYDIHNLDIFEKQNLSDGTMRVPILDVETALSKYGKETHH